MPQVVLQPFCFLLIVHDGGMRPTCHTAELALFTRVEPAVEYVLKRMPGSFIIDSKHLQQIHLSVLLPAPLL